MQQVSTVLVLLVAPGQERCTGSLPPHRGTWMKLTWSWKCMNTKNGFGRLNCQARRSWLRSRRQELGHARGDTDMMASLRKNFLPEKCQQSLSTCQGKCSSCVNLEIESNKVNESFAATKGKLRFQLSMQRLHLSRFTSSAQWPAGALLEQYFSAFDAESSLSHVLGAWIRFLSFFSCFKRFSAPFLVMPQRTQLAARCSTTTREGITRVGLASHPSSCHYSRTTLVHKPPKELGLCGGGNSKWNT